MPQNFYPELPVVAYFNGTIQQSDAVAYIQSITADPSTQQAVLALILNESGNLQSVINGVNACGFQSDSGRWNSIWDNVIVATTDLTDSTNTYRGFLVFDKWQSCFDMVLYYVVARGFATGTPQEQATKYYQNWVYGDSTYTPTAGEISGFVSLLGKAQGMLNGTAVVVPATAPPTTVVKYGSTDSTTNGMVTKIQTALHKLGLLQKRYITGNYLTLTEGAVIRFQRDKGLVMDGVAGSETLGTLGLG